MGTCCLYKQVLDPSIVASMSDHFEDCRTFSCYREIDNSPSTEQMINYRTHTTPEGIVTKVEIKKKVKGKKYSIFIGNSG